MVFRVRTQTRPVNPDISPFKRTVFLLVLTGLAYLFIELSSFLGLFLIKTIRHIDYTPIFSGILVDEHREILRRAIAGDLPYVIYSSTLGWTVKPDGFNELCTANSQGIRATREYSLSPIDGKIRIATFGDSFTHGNDVSNEDTWQEMLCRAEPDLEVLNFGVSAYGLDQAFLRYQQDGVPFHSHIVLIGFMSENINRCLTVFRPFYRHPSIAQPLTKPRYCLKGNDLRLIENPMNEVSLYLDLLADPDRVLAELGVNDYFFQKRYKPGRFDFLPSVRLVKMIRWHQFQNKPAIGHAGLYDTESEAFQITSRIVDRFVCSAVDNGSLPIVLFFPHYDDVTRYRKERTEQYTPLVDYLEERGYFYVDLEEGFERYGRELDVRALFGKGHHYSPRGNQIVASAVLDYLKSNDLLDLEEINRRCAYLRELIHGTGSTGEFSGPRLGRDGEHPGLD